jgi:ATP-dependent DNA helicase RecG
MNQEHLEQILSEGESLTVEFKRAGNGLHNDVFETVCSFSNRYGGYILLGVEDDGTVLGVNRNAAPDIKKNFINIVNDQKMMRPTLYMNLEEIEYEGKLILFVSVPISSQVEMFKNHIYDRIGDGDVDITANTDLVAHLFGRKSREFTERQVFPYATLDDLKLELVPKVKQMALLRDANHPWKDMDAMELFRSAGLYEDDKLTGNKGFNLAALLLFGRDEVILNAAPGYLTDCLLRRENTDRYDDRLVVECNLIEAYEQIIGFISRHTLDRFFIEGTQRVSPRNIIAREIASNILAHREYSSTFIANIVIGKDIIVAENWNRSNHHGAIDPEDFTPQPKNPLIARFFAAISYADRLGSGVRNLYKYSAMYSGKKPELIEGDVFKTIVPLTADDVPVNVPVNIPVSSTGKKILQIIAVNPNATLDEMAASLAVNRKTIQRNLKVLRGKGIVARVGADKDGCWEIVQ